MLVTTVFYFDCGGMVHSCIVFTVFTALGVAFEIVADTRDVQVAIATATK